MRKRDTPRFYMSFVQMQVRNHAQKRQASAIQWGLRIRNCGVSASNRAYGVVLPQTEHSRQLLTAAPRPKEFKQFEVIAIPIPRHIDGCTTTFRRCCDVSACIQQHTH